MKSEPIIKEEELDVDLIEGPVVTRQHIKDEYEARDLKVGLSRSVNTFALNILLRFQP